MYYNSLRIQKYKSNERRNVKMHNTKNPLVNCFVIPQAGMDLSNVYSPVFVEGEIMLMKAQNQDVCDLTNIALIENDEEEVEIVYISDLNEERENLFKLHKKMVQAEDKFQQRLAEMMKEVQKEGENIMYSEFNLKNINRLKFNSLFGSCATGIIQSKIKTEERFLKRINNLLKIESKLKPIQQKLLYPYDLIRMKSDIEDMKISHERIIKELQ